MSASPLEPRRSTRPDLTVSPPDSETEEEGGWLSSRLMFPILLGPALLAAGALTTAGALGNHAVYAPLLYAGALLLVVSLVITFVVGYLIAALPLAVGGIVLIGSDAYLAASHRGALPGGLGSAVVGIALTSLGVVRLLRFRSRLVVPV